MVVDNESSNDSMVRHLKSLLVEKAWLPLGGDLFHVQCSAHVFNLIMQDSLAVLGDLILKIRKTCKYLKKSTYASQKFECTLQQCKLKNKKKVALDVQTKWNSTYLMLESALPLKEAFNREWKVADVIHGYLKIFYDFTNHFNGRTFPTSNIFFPDVCKIQLKLREWENSQHDFLKVMVESCLVLGIGVVLDPRFKMNLVEFHYDVIYGSNAYRYVERVKTVFQDLYIEYGGQVSYVSNHPYPISSEEIFEEDYSAFDEW
ncbi:hypothetical protein M9H77_25974 [Catharanthus roseus]|uniref:Uncharacterized protein n=1 Tax=Catharanthus roseus TaxID=4058 RepID=A0ACC0ACF2_CATRO|nr:hypothetical protein M9H77_25974 [Catharanthus roseus]